MRAILIATGCQDGSKPLIDRYPDPLLPLLDRPFLQHVIEYLARQGVRQFDIVLSHRPEVVEGYFGDGTRWGCTFTYHLARDAGRPYRMLKTLNLGEQDSVLMGHADRLPAFELESMAEESGPLPLVTESDFGEVAWTGWAWLPADDLREIAADWTEREMSEHLLTLPTDRVVEHVLDARSFAGLLTSQSMVLAKEFAPLFLTGREIEPGVWLSRNVLLHPMAKVTAPVFIGEDCQIGPGVHVGPYAVIGRGCILGRDCTVSRSLVFPENYVGADLDLDGVVVDRNRIYRGEGTVAEADAFVLGSLVAERPRRSMGRIVSRLIALGLLLLAAPVLAATAIFLRLTRPGPVLFRRRVVVIPELVGSRRRTRVLWSFHRAGVAAVARGELPPGLRSLMLVILPALVHVVRGELSFAGVAPRTPEEVDRLAPEWRTLYLNCKAGIFTEAARQPGATESADQRYAAEAYYAAAGNWIYDIRLVLGYVCRALFGERFARAGLVS
jgi:NDP-sugar pyrophosphorylase family protein